MIRPPILRDEPDYGLGRLGTAARRAGNPELQALMEEYAEEVGLPPPRSTPQVEWDPVRCREIAQEFGALPFRERGAAVREAYRALADEIGRQFDFLSRFYAFDWYGDGDPVPYRDSKDMMEDVRRNRHLWVYTGGAPHSIWSDEENLRFRAVHDLFGHAAQGWTFGPHGEENAWVEHSKLFSPIARAALATETRGQNSSFNCGPHAHLPVAERPYAEQKGALLPEDRWTHPVLEEAYRDIPEFVYL